MGIYANVRQFPFIQGHATHGIVRVLREDVRQQLGHPPLDGVRVALDERADTKNGGMELTHGSIVRRGFLILRKFTDLDEADEAILQGEDTPAWRQTQDTRERAVFARA